MPIMLNNEIHTEIYTRRPTYASDHNKFYLACPYCEGTQLKQKNVIDHKYAVSIHYECESCDRSFSLTIGGGGKSKMFRVNGDKPCRKMSDK